MRIRLFTLLITSISLSYNLYAQQRNSLYEEYITKYKHVAIHEMHSYKIPASITLAQGLLESGAGRSTLARLSNNHFGIKCGSDWKGKSVKYNDDAPNECFRAYKDAKESYEDHSKFLKYRSRYASLFQLKTTDYKGWAFGLKKAGYATDPQYAYRLINIIELYNLNKLDTHKGSKLFETESIVNSHQPYIANGLVYIIVKSGDTLKGIGKEFDKSTHSLLKYNDLYKEYVIKPGDIIYLKKKNNKAQKPFVAHVVKQGDSMYSISQMYGIKLKSLYKLNKMSFDDNVPAIGTVIRLR